MNEDSPDSVPDWLRLSRAEAARYVGASSESTIRAAEDNGLEAEADADGQFWHTPAALDAWKWRCKPPSAAKKARILREAQRARLRDARERARQDEADGLQAQAEWEDFLRHTEAEQALRATVRQKARERREAFELSHLDERTAGLALGFQGSEARLRLRDLVNRGLLRPVPSPNEPRVEVSFAGAREVESTWPLCSGGPFFLRTEVLAMRAELAEVARDVLHRAPPPIQEAVQQTPSGVIIAELIRMFLEQSRIE